MRRPGRPDAGIRAPGLIDRLLGLEVLVPLVLLGSVALLRLRDPIGNPDLGSHLASGQRLLNDLAFPTTDPFSYMAEGQRWIVDTWLADILLAAGQHLFGPSGLIIVAAVVVGITFTIAQHACRALGARISVAFVVTLLTAVASAPTWFVDPRLLALLCMGIVVHILAVDRSQMSAGTTDRDHSHRWLLVPTLMLWVNTHPTFLLGLAVLGIDVITRWRAWLWTPRGGGLRWGRCILLAGVALGVTANPYGVELPLHVAGLGLSALSKASAYAQGLHTFEGQVVMALFFWTLLTVAISPAPAEPGELAAIVPLAVIAYASPAELAFFAVAAAPVLARHVEALLPPRIAIPVALSTVRRGIHVIALGTCGILFALGFKGTPASSATEALNPTHHPVEAVAFLNAQPALGRLFNHADWGGYLIDHLYPHYQVSMDGRLGLYSDASRSAYLETERVGPAWQQFLDECKADVVLWRRHHALIDQLESLPDWKRLYEDNVAVIFVRHTAGARNS